MTKTLPTISVSDLDKKGTQSFLSLEITSYVDFSLPSLATANAVHF